MSFLEANGVVTLPMYVFCLLAAGERCELLSPRDEESKKHPVSVLFVFGGVSGPPRDEMQADFLVVMEPDGSACGFVCFLGGSWGLAADVRVDRCDVAGGASLVPRRRYPMVLAA